MSELVEDGQASNTTHGAELQVTAPRGRRKAVAASRRRNQRGMTTAEYAVGTVAAVSFGGVLIKILTDPEIRELILDVIVWIIKTITGF